MEYMSVSQYKQFMKCEVAGLSQLTNPLPSNKSCLLQGNYFHSYCEGSEAFEKFKEENAKYIMMKSGKDKLSEYRLIDQIIEELESKPVQYKRVLDIIRHPKNQKEQIFIAFVFGAWWKIKMDIYNPDNGYFSDLKLMKDLYSKNWNNELKKYENFIQYFNYDLQMNIYAEVERIATKRKNILKPLIVCVTKQQPIDTAIFLGFEELDFCGKPVISEEVVKDVKSNTERIINIKKGDIEPVGCGYCEYCRESKITQYIDYNKFEV